MVCVRVLSTYTSQPSFLIGSKVGTAAFLYLLASAQELNFLPFGAVNVRQEFSSTSLVHPHLKVFFARGLPVFVVVATQDEAAPCTSADSVVAEEATQDEAAPSISYDSLVAEEAAQDEASSSSSLSLHGSSRGLPHFMQKFALPL